MRYVVLGGGSVTATYYLPALHALGRAAEVTVVEPDLSNHDRLKARFPDVQLLAQDHESFFAGGTAPSPQRCQSNGVAAIVALPNPLHVAATRLALENNFHVLCEKPLALIAADCRALADLAEAQGRRLRVAMARRYLPSMALAYELVRSGELGPIRSLDVHDCAPFQWQPRSYTFFSPQSGGVLADMGVHYLDYIQMLLGSLEPLSYQDDARGGVEASATYALRSGDVGVTLHLSRLDPKGTELRISCEDGDIIVQKRNESEVLVQPRQGATRRMRLDRPFVDARWSHDLHAAFRQLLWDFERNRCGIGIPAADGRDAENSTRLIEWAYGRRNNHAMNATGIVSRNQEGQNILVTGGTGFIGGHLIARLHQENKSLRVAVRSPRSCANVARYPIELAPMDVLDARSVREALQNIDTVYHLANSPEEDWVRRVAVDGTKHIVRAAIDAGIACVVVLSSIYVFGLATRAQPFTESAPYRPCGGAYGNAKAEMERWCLDAAKKSGRTRIVVLNPSCVFGPYGGAYTSLPVDLARAGRFCWVSGGEGYCNFTYVGNLVDAMIAAVTTPEAHGERFIVNDGAVTWREFFSPILGQFGADFPSHTPKQLGRLPRFGPRFRMQDFISQVSISPGVRQVAKRSVAARGAVRLTRRLGAMGWGRGASSRSDLCEIDNGCEDVYPPQWIGSLYGPEKSVFSAGKARSVLGWTPRVSLPDAQATTLAWLRETGRLGL